MGDSPSADEILEAVPDSIRLDDALTAMAHPHRRQLLLVLSRLETPERLSTLTRSLAVESDLSGDVTVDQLHTLLYHVHVPKLATAGIVSTDDGQETVDLTDAGRQLAVALDQ